MQNSAIKIVIIVIFIGVPRISQWSEFTGWIKNFLKGAKPVSLGSLTGVQWKAPIGVWGRSPRKTETKCEIIIQFLTYSCTKCRI